MVMNHEVKMPNTSFGFAVRDHKFKVVNDEGAAVERAAHEDASGHVNRFLREGFVFVDKFDGIGHRGSPGLDVYGLTILSWLPLPMKG
jgi:hypothetical protein